MPRTAAGFGRKNSFKVKLKKATVYSLVAWSLFCIAALLWISQLRTGGLAMLNDLLVNNFGMVTTWLLPFPFVIGGLMISKIKTSLAEPHTLLGSLIILIALAGLTNGGVVGGQLWSAASTFLSSIGGGLLLLCGLGIGIIIMFNIPFEDVLSFFVRTIKGVSSAGAKLKPSERPLGNVIKMGGMVNQNAPNKPSQPMKVNAPAPIKSSPTTPTMTITPSGASDSPWHYPPLSLLTENISGKADRGDVNSNAAIIERTLEAFGITAKVVEVNLGPAVTQYALEVAIGTKLSKISALSNDLALALAAPTGQIRIEAPIPGRSLVGIELPNRAPEFVPLRKIMESDVMKHHRSKLAVAMGLDVSGAPVVADIAKMPHTLIAGSTGSGKSVAINTFIASLLFRASPSEVKFIMVDPKRVELTGYNGIPHLLSPVIVEPEKVLSALKWAISEMEHRYKLFAEVGARNIDSYNELSGFQALPYIVIVIDELADLMMLAQVEAEDAITRLAQMARATGIHLVLATQRPSVDVITGLIKANIPTRIAFAVSSMVDSKVILDQQGAEKLLGRGDMLYVPPDQAKPTRIQGAFVSDREIKALIDFLKKQGIEPHYTEEVTNMPVSTGGRGNKGSSFISPNGESRDALFGEAVRLIVQNNNASASFLQRKLSVGYARAARLLDELESAGIVGPADGAKAREIVLSAANSYLTPETTEVQS